MRRLFTIFMITALCVSVLCTGSADDTSVRKVTLNTTQMTLVYPSEGNNEGFLVASIDPVYATIQTGMWTSSNEAVATVDPAGNVTATGAGNAVSCKVRVAQAVTAVEMKETSGTITVGKPVQLKATVQPQKAANKKLEWYSSNEEIATVSTNGQVKGLKPGEVTITAKSADGPSAEYHATVEMKPVTLKVSGKAKCIAKNHVGNSWAKTLFLNDEQVKGTGKVTVKDGDRITVEWVIEEYDKYPDTGNYYEVIDITPEIMTKGLTLEATVWVTENGGRYSGNSAEWRVTVTIKP